MMMNNTTLRFTTTKNPFCATRGITGPVLPPSTHPLAGSVGLFCDIVAFDAAGTRQDEHITGDEETEFEKIS